MRDKPYTGSVSSGVFTVEYSGYTPEQLLERLTRIAIDLLLTPKGDHIELYEPIGFTVALFLKESHILAEVYPEDNLLEFHIGSCKKLTRWQVEMAIDDWLGKIKGFPVWAEKQFFGWSCGHI